MIFLKERNKHNKRTDSVLFNFNSSPNAKEEEKSLLDTQNKKYHVLFVTAHPDDEAMFYTPTIRFFTESISGFVQQQKGLDISLLCLTTGSTTEQMAKTRTKELLDTVKYLKIINHDSQFLRINDGFTALCDSKYVSNLQSPVKVVVLDDKKNFQDGMNITWNIDNVAQAVKGFIDNFILSPTHTDDSSAQHEILLFTFDKKGISGHINHISTSGGIEKLLKNSFDGNGSNYKLRVFQMISLNKFRKFIAIFDSLFITLPTKAEERKKNVFHIFGKELIHDAMKMHKSQYVWFRKLFVAFSRYTSINSFREVSSNVTP